MSDHSSIVLPSKPRIISEEGFKGVYEIDGLYPGYGHTLGNSLRRIILSSLEGAAITTVKIDGVSHEFSTVEGVEEDVITIMMNLKRIRMRVLTSEPQIVHLKAKGPAKVTASMIDVPGQVEILTPDAHIATINGKHDLSIEMTVEKGLGYLTKESIEKNRVDIGTIALDAIFSPIRKANYEVENMRVGDRTDFNRLRLLIETDGTLTPREALEKSVYTMIEQLKSIVGFVEPQIMLTPEITHEEVVMIENDRRDNDNENLKVRVETLDLSARTQNALAGSGIRTVGGLARKREIDILSIDGLGQKGLDEIRKALSKIDVKLKD